MCGIVGFVGPGDRGDLAAMMAALAHRGPDGSGCYVDDEARLHLGHQRLAIIDIADGAQPMWNEKRDIGITYNGEIYNHVELRLDLERKGHRFITDHSDTEVLIHGYAEWGEDLPSRLNGMFAFCIYDKKKSRLFLARDRFGEKPLYVAQQGKLFAFASELHAIARHRGFSARLKRRSLQKFLAYGYVPAPNSILDNSEKIPGGGAMIFDLATSRSRTWRYWRFNIQPENNWNERPESELVDELRALLFDAVKRRAISDVPLGIFLSGGIDSSAILAAASHVLPKSSLQTFTLGFQEPSFDESAHARLVADFFHSVNHLEMLEISHARNLVPEVLSRLDEPSGDASVLPTFALSRLTRRHVTVALSGDGGDELFAGYDPFAALAPARLYQSLVPRPFHELLRSATNLLPVSTRNMSLDFKLRRTLMGVSYPPAMWNPVWMGPVEPALMTDLFHDALSPEELFSEALEVWESGQDKSDMDKALEFYTNFYLQDGILTKVDRTTMMVSLESRAVFLDNALVDFCQRLPHTFKMRNGQRKYLLKKALEGWLPPSILARRKKGFGVPTASWLKTMPKDPPLTAITGMRMNNVARAWKDHRSGKADHRLFLWSWLSLQSLSYTSATS